MLMPNTIPTAMDFILLEREVVVPSTTVQGEGVCVAAITILGDDIVEGNEILRVTIQPINPNDIISTSGNTSTITIDDDDGATVFLNETDIVVQEGDSNTTINICVVLQDDMGGLERDVVVTIILMPDTINTTTDLVLLEREVVIPSTTERGEGVCVAAITIIGDDSVEGNETFRVTIQPANPNDIVLTSESTANVTVIDDDGATLNLDNPEVSVEETDNVTTTSVCVSLQGSAELERSISLYVFTSNGTAGTEDFVSFEQGTVITSSFTMMRTLCQTITILGDRFIENDEFFFVMVIPSNPLDSITRNYSQITILDDDGAAIILQNASITTEEMSFAQVCITLQDVEAGLMRSVVVNVMTTPGTATPSDFTLLNNTLQFPSGSSVNDNICAVIDIIMDAIVERNETFTVSLSTENSNDEISPNNTLVTIQDDDGATVSLNETDIVVQEGDSNMTINICVVLQDDMGGLERDVVINLMTVPDTATFAMDFILLEGEVVIQSTTAQGEGVCVAAIIILGDDIVEGNETFRVTIQPTNPYDTVPTSGSTVNVTIVDDDELPPSPSPTSSPAESLSSTAVPTPSPSLPEVTATSPVSAFLTSSALELATSTPAVLVQPTSLLSTIQATSSEPLSSTAAVTAAITTSLIAAAAPSSTLVVESEVLSTSTLGIIPTSILVAQISSSEALSSSPLAAAPASSPVSVASLPELVSTSPVISLTSASPPTLGVTTSPVTIETTSVAMQITPSEVVVSSAASSSPIIAATSLSVVPQLTTSVAPTPESSPIAIPASSEPLPSPTTTTSTVLLSTPILATEQPTVLATPTPTQVLSSSPPIPSPSPTPGPEQPPPLVEGIDYIRFLTLGTNGLPTNSIQTFFPDDISSPINIPFGLPFGESIQQIAYVSTNGAISFGSGWFFWYPEPFPTTQFFVRNAYVVAPFWSDNDIRRNGTVRYEAHTRSTGTNSTSGQLLDEVSSFIVNQENLTTGSFLGQWMLVAEWDDVHPYPHGGVSVGVDTFLDKANTYQAIVITDGTQSYAVYTYNCQMLEWSGLFTHAVVGYNAEGRDFENNPLSGTADIIDIACENQERGTAWSNLIFNVGATRDLIQQRRAQCTRRLSEDMDMFGNITSTIARPCPCSIFQAFRDRRFRINFDVGLRTNLCFHQRFPIFGSRLQPTQLCCYNIQFSEENFGSLITSGEEGSSLLLFHPRFSRQNYLMYDIELRTACCGLAGMCDQFSERRPPNDCRLYDPPFFGWGWGDPHITTLDGRAYTFNGLGEYTLLQTEAEGGSGEFSLQARTALVVNSTATQYSAFAFGQRTSAYVEVRYENGSFVVLSNGNDISGNLTNVNDTYTDQAVEISRTSNDSITSAFSSDASVTIQVAAEIPNFVLALPQSFRGQTRGLLGNYNGQNSDEFVYRDGRMLQDNASDSMIHEFGQSWQISQNESLFTYADGQSVTTFSDPDHLPVFLDEVLANAAQEIVEACNGDFMCIFDFNQTGNADVGMATLMTNQNNVNDRTLALNYPPNITGANRFRVNTRQESVYTFNVTDDGGNFNVSLLGETPDNTELVTDGTMYTFRWMLVSPDNISVTFAAVDNLQARSVIDPQVEICACENGGTCTLDGVLDLDADPIVMNCECPEAWTGDFCEEDINGCSVVSCFEGVECFDVTAPGVGAMCGPCPTGYSGDGVKCSDIDECSRNNICEQVCVNTDGSFQCRCLSGFSVVNSTQCEDINECNTVNDCHQECINTVGSYECSCLEGFVLNSDNRTCSVMPGNECSQNNSCSQICLRINGTVIEQCSCMRGYQLSSDNETCDDVDECMMQPPCEQMCNNTVGSFMCSCGVGYTLNADGVTCDDNNECREAALDRRTLCPQPQLCENTPGSFQCVCPSGTEMINMTCREIEIPQPTRIQVLVSPTTVTEQPTVQPTATPTTTAVSNTALANALRITIPEYTEENFTAAVQERFRNTTAMVINSYCAENDDMCRQTVAVARQRRQVFQIQPGDVIITNITNNAQGQLEFVMFIQIAGGAQVLAVGVLENAVQSGINDYRNAGFTIEFVRVVIPTETPTARPGLSAGEIAGIVIGSVVGVLLLLILLLLFIFLCYKKCCRRGHKGGFEFTYGVVYREHGSDYVVHNELANIDETSVQSMKLTFLDQESQKSTPEPPSEKEELGSEDIVTAL